MISLHPRAPVRTHRASAPRRQTRRGREERGAAALEAALVTPILLIMMFGIVEMALLMRDHVALSSSVRAGGRTASSLPGAGAGDCDQPCTPANAPKLAQMAADSIERAGSAMPKDSISELWIYRANDEGYPGADGNTSWSCTTSCVKYAWVDARDQFRYLSGSWISSTISACANQSPDAVGVYIRATHQGVTGLFFDDLTMEDHAVFAFEPLPTLICGPGQHP